MEPLHSVSGKSNKVALFFVWLKSRIGWCCFVLCWVGESYECGGKEREESTRIHESAHVRSFWWSVGIQLFMVYSHMVTPGAAPLLFRWKPNI
jgi:hypothetical protein